MSRLVRCICAALFVAAVPAFGQSVSVSLPAPPMPSVHVVVPAPVVVVPRRVVVAPAPVVVVEERVVVVEKSKPGKRKGHYKK